MRIIGVLSASLTVIVALPVSVLAQTIKQHNAPVDFTTVSESSEHAFSVEVPKNWEPNTGITTCNLQPSLWMTASSPDHQAGVFVGDPNRQFFHIPGPYFPNGRVISNALGKLQVLPYQDASEFVANNGQRLLPAGARDVKLESVKDEAELAAKRTVVVSSIGASVTATTARYSFQQNGVPMIGSVTMQVIRNANGAWSELQATGYFAKPAEESHVQNIYEHAWKTLKPDPNWIAASNNRAQMQGSALLKQQADFGSAMLKQQADASQQRLNAMHEQGMQRIEAIGERGRQQAQADAEWHKNAMVNHYANMAVKDNNNYHEVLMIQNKHLEWSPTLQRNVEVPNY